MKQGAGRPTRGIRIESGKDVWNSIGLGSGFRIELDPSLTQVELLEPLPRALPTVADT
jgi:hypothetical protein